MTIRPGTSTSTLARIFIAAALSASPAWAQQGIQEPVLVSGAELQAWLSNGFVFAAEDHTNGSVFFVMGAANDRRLFYYMNEHSPITAFKGTQRVVGDTLCADWPFNSMGERCREWYRVGENRYEQRASGSSTRLATVSIIRK